MCAADNMKLAVDRFRHCETNSGLVINRSRTLVGGKMDGRVPATGNTNKIAINLLQRHIGIAITDLETPPWLTREGAAVSTIGFLAGGVILWGYAIKFYVRILHELDVKWSGIYLVILIGLNWLSPFIFIAMRGREQFFGEAPESSGGNSA